MTDAAESKDVWASISELVRSRDVRKSAISKRVTRLEREGLVHPRPGPLNSKEVNLAEFELACAQTTDEIRAQNGRAAKPIHRMAAEANGGRSTVPSSVAPADMGTAPSDLVLSHEQAKRM